MARDSQIVLEWADGEYSFALRVAQVEELEAISQNPSTGKLGIGFGAIWTRVMDGTWYISDVRNVIRLGLIGGGLGAVEANRLIKSYVDTTHLSDLKPDYSSPNCPVVLAQAILSAAVVGIDSKPVTPGKSQTSTSGGTSGQNEHSS